jgi:ABC-2 type transport system permease protein
MRLVALREVRERLHTRPYLTSTGILILLLGIGLALPKVISVPSTTYRFGLVGWSPAGLTTALRRAAAAHDAHVVVHRYQARQVALTALDHDRVDALLYATRTRLVSRRHVDHELHVHSLQPNAGVSDRTARLVALGGASLMLLAISIYGSWVMAGVAQEKTGRVAELLVAAIAPRHLLAGKVIGIGTLGLAQVALVATVVAAATAIGVTDLPSSFVPAAALVVPWFVLGFALYAVGFGVAGALVTRQEDVSTVPRAECHGRCSGLAPRARAGTDARCDLRPRTAGGAPLHRRAAAHESLRRTCGRLAAALRLSLQRPGDRGSPKSESGRPPMPRPGDLEESWCGYKGGVMHTSNPLVGHWMGVGVRLGLAAGAVTGILVGGGLGVGLGMALGALLGAAAGALADHRWPRHGR